MSLAGADPPPSSSSSGFSLWSEMLRRPDLADVPVIVLSAFWRRPGETLDAFAAFPKPLNVERLIDAVRRAIGLRREPAT